MEIFDKFFTFIRHICIVRYRMINTYNETSLHRELKEIYAQKYQGRTEIEIENYICDIVCNDKNSMIIEIQTSNLSKVTDKIEKLSKTHKVKLMQQSQHLNFQHSYLYLYISSYHKVKQSLLLHLYLHYP